MLYIDAHDARPSNQALRGRAADRRSPQDHPPSRQLLEAHEVHPAENAGMDSSAYGRRSQGKSRRDARTSRGIIKHRDVTFILSLARRQKTRTTNGSS